MYNVKSLKAEEFISDEEIKETLEYAEANKNNIGLIDAIIEKAKLKKGLTHREASVTHNFEVIRRHVGDKVKLLGVVKAESPPPKRW